MDEAEDEEYKNKKSISLRNGRNFDCNDKNLNVYSQKYINKVLL